MFIWAPFNMVIGHVRNKTLSDFRVHDCKHTKLVNGY